MRKNIVYSTNPNWKPDEEDSQDESIASNQQQLRVRLETKHRAGKKATVILGFQGSAQEQEELAKTLKTKLGTGGSSKDNEIVIQGDYVSKVKSLLIQLGFKNTK